MAVYSMMLCLAAASAVQGLQMHDMSSPSSFAQSGQTGQRVALSGTTNPCNDPTFPFAASVGEYVWCYKDHHSAATKAARCDLWCTLDVDSGDNCDGCCGDISKKKCQQQAATPAPTADNFMLDLYNSNVAENNLGDLGPAADPLSSEDSSVRGATKDRTAASRISQAPCSMAEFALATNENNKATELPLWKVNGSVQHNPHMRAFWGATVSFFLAFLGWFAMAPLSLEIAHSMDICENQLYPPAENPKRKAFLKFKNLKTEKLYCRYGKNDADSPTDCKPVPDDIMQKPICGFGTNATDCATEEERNPYDPSVFGKCVCTGGTKCRSVIADAGVAAVASTIFVRVALGNLLERFGPVNVQCGLLVWGAIWVFAGCAISAPWNYTMIRFFIGAAGATFVTNQFWCSLMFAPNIVGTANATAAGWGNLGGGVTQIFMIVVLFEPFKSAGMEAETAWRSAMVVPAVLFLLCAAALKLLCWDTPVAKRFDPAVVGKVKAPSMMDYVEVCKDPRVWVLIFQYSACFGTELAMNNQLATHFRTYFQMSATDASVLAGCFGLMNLFARSLGGLSSDVLFAKFGFRGRLWAQFLALFFEAIFLFAFGSVDNTQKWYTALGVLIFFSLFVQMAEGTTYGIVPFVAKQQLAVWSALVGAGGNLGAVIAGWCFYKPIEDDLLPFKVHGLYVMFWALANVLLWWPEHGGMFSGPTIGANEKNAAQPDKVGGGEKPAAAVI